MKYDAIINSGIKIVERVPIPPELIPKDAQVEIAAKVSSSLHLLRHSITTPHVFDNIFDTNPPLPWLFFFRFLLVTMEATNTKSALRMT